MEDHELEVLAKRLGEREAAGVDADRTAEAVVARLRTAPVVVRLWRKSAVRWIAAAAVLLVAIGLAVYQPSETPVALDPTPPVPVTIEELAATELTELMDSLEVEAPVSEFVPVSLEDLSSRQLETLLQSMEG